MTFRRAERVAVAGDGALLQDGSGDVLAVTGLGGTTLVGVGGLAYAGQGGTASANTKGIAIAGINGVARAGGSGFAMTRAGGSATADDDSVAWAGSAGVAVVRDRGVAVTYDGHAACGESGVAAARHKAGVATRASGGPYSVCIVRSEAGGAAPGAHPATAVAGANGVAVAYGLNYVSGDVGAVLVGAYTDVNNVVQMAHARVGDPGIAPFVRYSVNQAGAFVAVPDARDGGGQLTGDLRRDPPVSG